MACADTGRGPRWFLFASSYALLAACASQPVGRALESAPPVVLSTIEAAGIRDLRAEYRAATCARLPANGPACEDVLLRLRGEGEVAAPKTAADLPRRYRVAFVPGLFSDCFDRYARPFDDSQRALEAEGFSVDYFRVPGRGTAAGNGSRLAEHFSSLPDDERPLIVFAYSKGLPDVLEFVVSYPEAAARIAAVVSIAGAANGSPLADELYAAYRRWAAAFPLPGCDAGSGDEIEDLRRDVRLEWWRRNRNAVTIPVFALVTAPRPEQVSPAMRPMHDRLARIDSRNDGRLLAQDQMVPGSYLLGYANADHLAIATPLANAFPSSSLLFRDVVPRPALVRAAIDVVADTLSTPKQR